MFVPRVIIYLQFPWRHCEYEITTAVFKELETEVLWYKTFRSCPWRTLCTKLVCSFHTRRIRDGLDPLTLLSCQPPRVGIFPTEMPRAETVSSFVHGRGTMFWVLCPVPSPEMARPVQRDRIPVAFRTGTKGQKQKRVIWIVEYIGSGDVGLMCSFMWTKER